MPPLTTDEIHIWTWPTTDSEQDGNLLDESERTRLASYRSEVERNRFGGRHQGLRRLLARYCAMKPESLRFSHNSHGKPRLICPESGPDIHFSLSHCRQLNGLAIRLDQPLGLDIEDVDGRLDHQGLARRCFAPEETHQLATCPTPDKAAWFCRFWTLKEAFIKACGLGLSLPLKSFAIQGIEEPPTLISAPPEYSRQEWQFNQWQLTGATFMSVAATVSPGQKRPLKISRNS
ncbi:MAG: 4'-phosphopantetheinyl transferase superfamily protein, partial [Thermodesulfobacteriota bacterium]